MIDVDALRRLAADDGPGPEELLGRLDRTLHRRGRFRAAVGGVVALLVVLTGVEAFSTGTGRPTPTVLGSAAGPPAPSPQPCPEAAVPGRTRRLAAGALTAAALAGCTDGGAVGGAPSPGGSPDPLRAAMAGLERGAALVVEGDDDLAGVHVHPQVSEALLLEIPEEAEGPRGYAVTLEFLDDEFDWIRIDGSVAPGGVAELHPTFRIAGQRFPAPPCDLEIDAVPPGPVSGTFTCRAATDVSGEHTVDVTGRFVLGDLRPRDFGGG